jgi:hypothetical protein
MPLTSPHVASTNPVMSSLMNPLFHLLHYIPMREADILPMFYSFLRLIQGIMEILI